MKVITRVRIAAAVLLTVAVSEVHAGGKLEKVDMVREGIDTKPIVVRATPAGYTGYVTASHDFMVRTYAKAGWGDGTYWVAISWKTFSPFEVPPQKVYFQQSVGTSDGWSTYQKSHVLTISPKNVVWSTATPLELCTNNAKAQMARGMPLASVLNQEWKLTAYAQLAFSAAADDKANNRQNNHKVTQVAVGGHGILYPVMVTCGKI